MGEGEATYSVYESLDTNGQVQYVGITNDLTRRESEHWHLKKIRIREIPGLGDLNWDQARGVEQALIEKYGRIQSRTGKALGGRLLNEINSIDRRKPRYKELVAIGKAILLHNGYHP
jgi:hypothetical protein